MTARPARYLILAIAVASAGCRHSLTREEALSAIEHGEPLRGLLAPDSERVAHETVADCRAMYSDDPRVARMAGDSAWILLSSAGLLDLADVDAPADPRQKKHCRALLTSKANKAAFHEAEDARKSPWTSYWTVETAHAKAELIDIPAHTAGHVCFHLPEAEVAFTGDTLFAMGCGRLFEGDAAMMFGNMQRLAALPPDTRIFCGHEYTLANGEFALTVEPDNATLARRVEEVRAARDRGEVTLPTTIALELATNPFMRARSVEELAARRAAKDAF